MIVLVTGLMRTGTSLISKQLHELGIPMGSKMRFPLMRENAQLDFEDVEFTDNCLAALKGHISVYQLERFIVSYVNKREAQGIDPWGVKSPFVLPYIDLFKKLAEDDVKVIVTVRDIDSTLRSIERQTRFGGPKDIQKLLIPSLDNIKADLVVPIEESWKNPDRVKDKLINLIRS